jgi:hypothetical protein
VCTRRRQSCEHLTIEGLDPTVGQNLGEGVRSVFARIQSRSWGKDSGGDELSHVHTVVCARR